MLGVIAPICGSHALSQQRTFQQREKCTRVRSPAHRTGSHLCAPRQFPFTGLQRCSGGYSDPKPRRAREEGTRAVYVSRKPALFDNLMDIGDSRVFHFLHREIILLPQQAEAARRTPAFRSTGAVARNIFCNQQSLRGSNWSYRSSQCCYLWQAALICGLVTAELPPSLCEIHVLSLFACLPRCLWCAAQ